MTPQDFMFICFGIAGLVLAASVVVWEVRRRKFWREHLEKRNDQQGR